MAFKPITMDGQAAAAKLLKKGTNRVHQCLAEVFSAFPFEASDQPGAYTSARVQWERTPQSRRHPGDRGVPPGALVFFDLTVSGTKDPRPGHIGISVGGDRFVSTDWPTRGKVSVAKIEDVEEAWRARYLGWTDVIGGHNVTVGRDPDVTLAGSRSYPHRQVVLADLNLRKSPKTGAVITVIPAGTVVKTGRTVAGWTPVKYGTRTGWVAGEFVILRTRRVNHSSLTLRDKPASMKKSKSNPKPARRLVRLTRGTKVTVLGVHGKTDRSAYWKVRVGNRTGWVIGKYLT